MILRLKKGFYLNARIVFEDEQCACRDFVFLLGRRDDGLVVQVPQSFRETTKDHFPECTLRNKTGLPITD